MDSRITRLRRRLEKDAAKPELIKTIRGVGYRYPRR
ncbi:MAG: winged helix family transcriptional regulator [Mesorhizobium sp.]|nr:MAG: winged helix family transcriptional regulator [Mesorhizobium sp.]RWM69889.1 MAG: winged helix family transcriptional regulator [Mesorhizobium sp.]TIO23204.1 MAG: winged helix family transcriptional regulator [Mesorhizobium sp.]TIQ17503.1 MAG: winged helix family transcriptional regulator [Mesorhizobium sp.]TJV55586.1 MAG: winged helix family transcriptional regulator [Mesorhizobium sp.]